MARAGSARQTVVVGKGTKAGWWVVSGDGAVMAQEAQVSEPSEAVTSEAERSVASAWFGMTVLRATALLGMIVAYLAALGAVFRWFGDAFRTFREQDPWLFWPLVVLPLLFIAAFSV